MSELTSIQEQVLQLLGISLKNKTPKGWYMGSVCPKCGRGDKFGVKLNYDRDGEYKNHISVHCFHGSCEFSGSEKSVFRLLGRDDLIVTEEYREDLGTLSRLKLKSKEEEAFDVPELPNRYPPLGFKRVYQNEYLESRGFTVEDFERYVVGKTNIETRLKDYLIFLIYENEKNKGYIGRIGWDSEKYKEENEKRKEKGLQPIPKYRNEGGVEFSETLYGIDELTPNTTTVILVEGILDKISVDREMELHQQEEVRCLCTFGKKISQIQVHKIWKRGVTTVILMYDPDAVQSMKEYSYSLSLSFEKVLVAKLTGDKDPGGMKKQDFLLTLQNLESFLTYQVMSLNKRDVTKEQIKKFTKRSI